MSAATIVEPTGVPPRMAVSMPINAHATERTAAQMVTLKKLRQTRMAANAGKTMSAEISREPTRFIASTMMTATTTARNRLQSPVRTPPARADVSSNVMAKIRS